MVWNYATAKCEGGGRGMCIIKHESLFCERCGEPQNFCAAVWGEVDLRYEESPFSGLKVTLGDVVAHVGHGLGPRRTRLWSQVLFLAEEHHRSWKLFWDLLVNEAACKESPSCGKNSPWNRHIISKRGQEGLDVPTSGDCEKLACAPPWVHFTVTHTELCTHLFLTPGCSLAYLPV